jgi:acetyltransferase-like isoleucine patch superfamily enzyme/dTDP-4-dehydrorhamnose 3,5-epimerase-like enzyme
MSYFVHPQGLCETREVGAGTQIWAFAHVLAGARIGRDCNICDHIFIENDVVLGDRVTIKCGVQLWDGTRIDDDVFIGPNATFANDKFPRSKAHQTRIPETHIGRGASIGANSTIMPGLQIGRYAMVGAGSVVTGDVPPYAKVLGNPARIAGYVNSSTQVTPRPTQQVLPSGCGVAQMAVAGVSVHRLHTDGDLRGRIASGMFGHNIPFVPRRYFVVHDVPSKEVRGEHALRSGKRFLVCVAGSMSVVVDDGRTREEILLDGPDVGVLVSPMVWTLRYRHTPDAILLAFASDAYDPADYIRDYEEFMQCVGETVRPGS